MCLCVCNNLPWLDVMLPESNVMCTCCKDIPDSLVLCVLLPGLSLARRHAAPQEDYYLQHEDFTGVVGWVLA